MVGSSSVSDSALREKYFPDPKKKNIRIFSFEKLRITLFFRMSLTVDVDRLSSEPMLSVRHDAGSDVIKLF